MIQCVKEIIIVLESSHSHKFLNSKSADLIFSGSTEKGTILAVAKDHFQNSPKILSFMTNSYLGFLSFHLAL